MKPPPPPRGVPSLKQRARIQDFGFCQYRGLWQLWVVSAFWFGPSIQTFNPVGSHHTSELYLANCQGPRAMIPSCGHDCVTQSGVCLLSSGLSAILSPATHRKIYRLRKQFPIFLCVMLSETFPPEYGKRRKLMIINFLPSEVPELFPIFNR